MAAPPIKPPSKPGQKPLPPPVPDDEAEAADTDGLAPAAAAAGFLTVSAFELDVGAGLPTGRVSVLAGDAAWVVDSVFPAGSDFADAEGADVEGGLDTPPVDLPSTLCVCDAECVCDADVEPGVAALSEGCPPLVPAVVGSEFRA